MRYFYFYFSVFL